MKMELIADPAAQTNVNADEVSSALCSYKIEPPENADNVRTSATSVQRIFQNVMQHARQQN